MPAPKKNKTPAPVVPQTSLVKLADALYLIGATVDVASSALARNDDPESQHASTVLNEHVFYPLTKIKDDIREQLSEERKRLEAPVVQHLVRKKRRKKRAPNGSRKGKKRQRNRWKEREAERKRRNYWQ